MIVGSLEIKLFASLARLQSDMDKAGKTVDTAMSRIDKAIGTTKAAFTGLAGAFGAQTIVRLADEYKRFDSQLKLATKSASQYEEAYSRVVEISAKSQSDIGAIGVLYARLANNLRDAGASQREVGDIAESISLSLRVANATVQETNSVMLQLSQSFGSGKLNGQEFLAVAEGAPALLRQVAKEMGVAYGELKNLATEGKISADVLKRAWTNPEYLAGVREQVKQVGTIASAMTVLKNNLTVYIGEADKATNTSRTLSQAIIFLSENINLLVTGGLAYLIVSLGKYVSGSMAAIAASRLEQIEMVKKAVVAERAAAAEIAAENAKRAAMTKSMSATYGAAAAAAYFNKNLTEKYQVIGEVAKRTGTMTVALNGLRAVFSALGGWVTVTIVSLTALWSWFQKNKTASEELGETIRKRIVEEAKNLAELRKLSGGGNVSSVATKEQLALNASIKERARLEQILRGLEESARVQGKLSADQIKRKIEVQDQLTAAINNEKDARFALEQATDAEKARDPKIKALQEFELLNSALKTSRNEQQAYNQEVANYIKVAREAGISEQVIAEGVQAIANKYATLRKEAKTTAKEISEANKERLKDLQDEIDFETEMLELKNKKELELAQKTQEEIAAATQKRMEIEQQRANENFAEAQRLAAEEVSKQKDIYKDLKDAIDGYSKDMARSMADFMMGTKSSFSDMINSMLRDLLRLTLQRTLFDPLTSSISNSLSSGGGLLGMVGEFFGGNGGVSSTAGAYSIDQNPYLNFGGARANGGAVSPNKTYLVGERGAELFTPSSSGSITPNHQLGGNVSVVINNNSQSQATAVETKDARGNRRIEVTIGDMVAGEIKRTGSSAYQAINGTFATRPRLVGR